MSPQAHSAFFPQRIWPSYSEQNVGDSSLGGDGSVNIFDVIETHCKEFRREWKAGSKPRIETFLDRVPKHAKETLFRNLLLVEIRYRQRMKETPSSDEYFQRFPAYKRVVGDAFLESTSMSFDAMQETPDSQSVDVPVTIEVPNAQVLGEYELLHILGRGGFGVVYKARHLQRNHLVALKTLPTGNAGQQFNAERLHRFRREFRSLSEVNHPNLVGMQTLEVEGDQWFLTMDLVDGIDFLSFVRPEDEIDEGRVRSAAKQIAEGIIALHAQGIVHRDLKPSNVLVDETGHVSILDFGLVAELQRASDQTVSLRSNMFAGTPRYAAPEQMFGDRSEASDWYALGVMIYEALTGNPPFDGGHGEILLKKQQEDPPRLVDQSRFPEDLARLVDGMLKREPSERITTASIIEAFSIDSNSTVYSSGSEDESCRFSTVGDGLTALVGRDEQLDRLNRVKSTLMETRQPTIVFISGRSGEGKSSLADAFLNPVRIGSEMLVFSGRCYDRESVPFKAIDCWLDALVGYLRSKSDEWLRTSLPSDMVAMAHIFPVLRRIHVVDALPPFDNALMTSEKLRHRAFMALRDLLRKISEETPVVLFVDDLQWGDAQSVDAIQKILATPDAPAIAFIGSYRSDEREQSPFLQQWDLIESDIEQHSVGVGPLTEGETAELASRIVPNADEEAQTEIQRAFVESSGNPYFLTQLLESYEPESGQFRPVPIGKIIESRLTRLPSESKPILEALCVAGQSMEVSELSLVCGFDDQPIATLTKMRNERLVRLVGGDDHQRVDTFHDKVRESVLRDLPRDDRIDWHRKHGENLERLVGAEGTRCEDHQPEERFGEFSQGYGIERLFDLAYHFHECDDPRAFDYQVLAGEESLRIYSNDEAVRYLTRARSLLDNDRDTNTQFRVLAGLGRAWMRCRNAEQAVELLTDAHRLASTRDQRVSVQMSLGIANADLGASSQAIKWWDEVLGEVGARRPKSKIALMTSMLLKSLRISLFPEWGRKSSDPLQISNEAVEFRITGPLWLELLDKDVVAVVECQARHSAAGVKSTNEIHVALGHCMAGMYFAGLGLQRTARKCHARYLRRSQQTLQQDAVAIVGWHEGMSHYYRCELSDADRAFCSSIDAAEKCRDNRSMLFSTHMLRHTRGYHASSSSELDVASSVLRLAQEVGDIKATCWGYYDVADALSRAGRIEEALDRMTQAYGQFIDEEWNCTEPICGTVYGYVLLQASAYKEARAALQRNWKLIKAHKMYFEYTVRSLPLLLESIIGPKWNERLPRNDVKAVKRLARWNSGMYRLYPTLQPMMLRAGARVCAMLGKNNKALRLLQKSIAVAEKRGMPYFQARAMLDLAVIHGPERERLRTDAIDMLRSTESVIPRAEGWQLGDQYDEAVVAEAHEFDAAKVHEILDEANARRGLK